MLTEYDLDIDAALDYAKRWAFARNPQFADFDTMGGDCTNFISQCLYAGGAIMNNTRDTGWYYRSLNDRAAAWTSVMFFYRFIISNRGIGPFGTEIPLYAADVGDIVQLGMNGIFYHNLLICSLRYGEIFVAAHTIDSFDRPLSTYQYENIRCLRIRQARRYR